jgi:hypothetical protein
MGCTYAAKRWTYLIIEENSLNVCEMCKEAEEDMYVIEDNRSRRRYLVM